MACAASHILGLQNTLTRMHGDIFKDAAIDQQTAQRLLGYWIFTYGTARLMLPMDKCTCQGMVASNYFAEAIAYFTEGFIYKTADKKKAAWVSATSFALGFCTLLL